MVTGMEVSRIRSLFDVLPNGPYLPLYDVFADIFSRDREPGAAPLGSYEDIKALARWLQRRVDIERRDAMTIARDLNRAVDADESVFDATQRMRHEDMNSAAATAADIDGDVSSAHARYKHWLQERTK